MQQWQGFMLVAQATLNQGSPNSVYCAVGGEVPTDMLPATDGDPGKTLKKAETIRAACLGPHRSLVAGAYCCP